MTCHNWRWLARPCVLFCASVAVLGCDLLKPKPSPTTEPVTSTSETPPVAPPPAPSAPDSTPKGTGIGTAKAAADKETGCNTTEFEIAKHLIRGELSLAGRPGAKESDGEFAASWLIELQGRAQIAFAGFDHKSRRIGRDRGIGNAREHAPKLFGSPDRWTVVWFDDLGLAYAHPVWEASPKLDIAHFTAIKEVAPAQVTIAPLDGGFLVSSPFGSGGDQASLFKFSPTEGQKATAVGITKDAVAPQKPVAAPSKDGFSLAWFEAGGEIRSTKFDATGTQIGPSTLVAAKSEGRVTLSLSLTPFGADSLLVYVEGERVVGRLLDETARPKGDVFVIGAGKTPQVLADGDSAIVVFVGKDGELSDAVLAARVNGGGAIGAEAVRLNAKPTPDTPAVALANGRLAFAWTETMGSGVATKRAWLRIIDKACVK